MKYQILDNKVFIKIEGRDAHKFLESITTNTVDKNAMSYHLILSPQGRIVCDFFVFHFQESYFLEVASVLKEKLLEVLNKYQMRSAISISQDMDQYTAVYSTNKIGLTSFKDVRYEPMGYKSIVKMSFLLEGFEIDNDLYNSDKYKYGIPEGGIDMICDKTIPLECGIDILHGISYTKGCYPGQEVIARTKYQGVIRKKIYTLTATNDIAGSADKSILMQGLKIGEICSSYKNKGICLMREISKTTLQSKVQIGGREYEGVFTIAPWY